MLTIELIWSTLLFHLVHSVVSFGPLYCFIWSTLLFQLVCSIVSFGLLYCFIWSTLLFHLVHSIVSFGPLYCFIWSTLLFHLVYSIVSFGLLYCFIWSTLLFDEASASIPPNEFGYFDYFSDSLNCLFFFLKPGNSFWRHLPVTSFTCISKL